MLFSTLSSAVRILPLLLVFAVVGCGSSNTTVQPATPEPVPADAPVDEPPSTDES